MVCFFDTESHIVCLFDTESNIVCLFDTDIDIFCLFDTYSDIVCLFDKDSDIVWWTLRENILYSGEYHIKEATGERYHFQQTHNHLAKPLPLLYTVLSLWHWDFPTVFSLANIVCLFVTDSDIVCLFDTYSDIVCLFDTDIDCLFYADIGNVC